MLLKQAERCKKLLSEQDEVVMHATVGDQLYESTYTMDRLFEESKALLKEIRQVIGRALKDGKMTIHDVDLVVMAGGSSKMPLIQKYINVLGEAVDQGGGPQIRNIGTIGGNTCNGVTSADSSSTLHAWDAIVELTGKNGVRRLPIHEFYIKAGKVDIRAEDGEIQTAILIPKESYDRCYGHYIKYAMRNAMDIATLGCSVNVRLSENKKAIERARIAYGVAGPVPLRCASAEAAAQGKPLTEETVETFAHAILDDINPRDSWRASKAFRQHIAVEIAKRCLVKSIELAGGELA